MKNTLLREPDWQPNKLLEIWIWNKQKNLTKYMPKSNE